MTSASPPWQSVQPARAPVVACIDLASGVWQVRQPALFLSTSACGCERMVLACSGGACVASAARTVRRVRELPRERQREGQRRAGAEALSD